MEFNIDEVVRREQELGWHKGRPMNPNLPEAKLTKIPTGPVGSQPGWTNSLGFDEFKVSSKTTTDKLYKEELRHIIVTTDVDYANELCIDWYYLQGSHMTANGLTFVLQRLSRKRTYEN
tara:strand:- start:2270 stop:2626 length:357 start_codon:yes stop_codon:yes gene_type:complete